MEITNDGLPSEAFAAIQTIFANYKFSPKIIFLAGVHHGGSALRYLQLFPSVEIYGFEPNSENFALAKEALEPFADRVHLFPFALSSENGEFDFNTYSRDATHSLFEIGKLQYWDQSVNKIAVTRVTAVTIDSFVIENQITNIDILHLDIQGGELLALHGCQGLLQKKSIFLIRCESEFVELYDRQPLFWEIGLFLNGFRYRFIKNVDKKFRHHILPHLVWADSIFISDFETKE